MDPRDDPGPVVLTRVGPDDWRLFRDVRLSSLSEAPGAFGSRHADWVDAPEERWRARLVDVPLTVVARAGDHQVGVVSALRSGGHAELISLWVAPSQRGTGLVDRLLTTVLAWAAAEDRGTGLMVREDNPRAIGAYTRAGFLDAGVPADQAPDEPTERRMWHGGLPPAR